MIQIFFNPEESDFSNLSLTIDNKPVDFVVSKNIIVIEESLDSGLHELKLVLLAPSKKLSITEVEHDGICARQTIYFSFLEYNGIKDQPATTLWAENQTWIYRFGLPFNWWYCNLLEKIYPGDLGKNLFDLYDIYWPENFEVGEHYPKMLQDFFKYNHDFTICHKLDRNIKNIPYQRIDSITVPDLVKQEILHNDKYIIDTGNQSPRAQQKYNLEEFNTQNLWTVANITDVYSTHRPDRLDPKVLPNLYNWINNLGLDIELACIAVLTPGSFVYPHVDIRSKNFVQDQKYRGCTEIYLPVNWDKGNYFKLMNVGILPLEEGPCIINQQDHAHALVNKSDQTRFSILIVCDTLSVKDRLGLQL